MNKITGAILIVGAAISGHAVFVFLASHPQIRKFGIPTTVSNLVMVAIGVTTVFGLWGTYLLLKRDQHP
jgi:hypothetical protein